MTLKEAILKALDDITKPTNHTDVCKHIIETSYYDFGTAKTPRWSVAAELGNFIRKGDTRVKRIKVTGGTYSYYLTKNEQNIIQDNETIFKAIGPEQKKADKAKTYDEKDLHKLLSSYLKNISIYSKTIPHVQSKRNDNNQIWTHPDMVGIRFLKLKSKFSQNFFKAISPVGTFELFSYEIKKEIYSDVDLKESFFQAVSNSSWSNYGYLVNP